MQVSRRVAIAGAATIPFGIAARNSFVLSRAEAATPDITGDLPQDVAALLDPGDKESPMRAVLERKIEFGSALYYIIAQYQEDTGVGEPIIIKKPINGAAVILEDFVGLPQVPVPAGFDDLKSIDVGLFALAGDEAVPDRAPQPVSAEATKRQDLRVATAARQNLGLNTRNARGTNEGRLACAWAVNQVVSRALGRPILAGPQGLATANMVKVLAAKHVRIVAPVVGSIVISPTVYSPRANIGHVGIVGENDTIFSNSSRNRQWEQNFTVSSWDNYYGKRKGLQVAFFRLDDVYFPQPL